MRKLSLNAWLLTFIFVYSIFTVCPISAQATIDPFKRIKVVTNSLNTIFSCPDRIWPGLKKKTFRIIFVEASNNKAWVWSAQSGDVEALNIVDVPGYSTMIPQYAFEHFRGARVVVINFDEIDSSPRTPLIPVDKAVNLAFHEGFHFLFQMSEPWVSHFTSVGRANIDYVNAIYARQMLIKSLKDDLVKERGFGRSAFWYQQWLKLGEENETRFSDILEGTANYAEVFASAIALLGCDISEKKLINKVVTSLDYLVDLDKSHKVRKELYRDYVSSGYQIEGYDIGLLSLLAKRINGTLVGETEYPMGRNYFKEIEHASQGEKKMQIMEELQKELLRLRTPVQLAIEGYEPIHSDDNSDLLEAITRATQD